MAGKGSLLHTQHLPPLPPPAQQMEPVPSSRQRKVGTHGGGCGMPTSEVLKVEIRPDGYYTVMPIDFKGKVQRECPFHGNHPACSYVPGVRQEV